MMRTTVNLPDDVYHVARSLAGSKGVSLGDAIAELVRRGLSEPVSIDADKPFPCFVIPPDSGPITLETTLAVEEDW
jgi:hypothetical protein